MHCDKKEGRKEGRKTLLSRHIHVYIGKICYVTRALPIKELAISTYLPVYVPTL